MAGLLFLAFAYLAVGQAGVNRGGAQTAADAAALAAGQETRDQLTGDWVDSILDPAKWQDIFDGGPFTDGCGRAAKLAAANDATLDGCLQGTLRYTVDVTTNKPVGDSIVPGTENQKARARAVAVVVPKCTFEPLPGESASPSPTPSPSASQEPAPPVVQLPRLICDDGSDWTLDPRDLTRLPEPQDLFDVHLAD